MKTTVEINHKKYQLDLRKPIFISTPFSNASKVKAFFAPDTNIKAVITDDFIGSTTEGGILNFKNIFMNPHGNGTHTECLGHIAKEPFHIIDCLKTSHHIALLQTIHPEVKGNDTFISKEQVEDLDLDGANCIILRTTPNEEENKLKDWSGTNPTYITHEAMQVLVEKGVEHFMIDTPSVDRESDEGKLLAHKTFWNYPSKSPRENATITEMVYVSNNVTDGIYLVDIQILPLKMDASPSNVVLYKIT